MSESELSMQKAMGGLRGLSTELPNLRHVLACVDGVPFAEAVLTHAVAVAEAVGARITVIHVLESSAAPAVLTAQDPMDPVEWTQRHCATTAYLRERMLRFGDLHADVVIVAGRPAERISTWAQDNAVDLVVLGRGGKRGELFSGLGDTARRVVEMASASVLLVPSMQAGDTSIRYRKVLVPLDGSSRSECVLPLGLGIAAAHGAEVVLVHAAPKFDLIEGDLLNAEAITLRDQLYRHNENAARQYLSRLRSRLPAPPATGTRLLPGGDARRALVQAAMEERADLMVISAVGKSGHADMAVGSVADYLISRIGIAVLLVRQQQTIQAKTHVETCDAMDIRQPNQRMI